MGWPETTTSTTQREGYVLVVMWVVKKVVKLSHFKQCREKWEGCSGRSKEVEERADGKGEGGLI